MSNIKQVIGTTKEALVYVVGRLKSAERERAADRKVLSEILTLARSNADWQRDHDARHETALREQREATSARNRATDLRRAACDDRFADYDVALAALRERGHTGGGDAGSAPAPGP